MSQTFDTAITQTVHVAGVTLRYRKIGSDTGTPLVMLHHLTGVLEDWDPRTVDALAQERTVIIFDNRGVGGSSGVTPDSVEEMAKDVVSFIDALNLTQVDLFGYSLGGFVAQVVAQSHPALVRRLILAGTSGPGGKGISEMGKVLQDALAQGAAENKHPKEILFFPATNEGRQASAAFLKRLTSRPIDRDPSASNETIVAQITAITKWGMTPSPATLDTIRQPVLVTTGDVDRMAPTINSVELFDRLPNAVLSIFPAAGHGAIFQEHAQFLVQASRFLQA